MIGFTLLLVASAAAFALSRGARLPVIPVLMISGALLGLFNVAPDREMLRRTLELGITVLAFTVGMELNPQRFAAQRSAVPWVGIVQMLVAGVLGYGVARALGMEPIVSLYCAFALSASSTLVVLRHMRQQRQLFEPFGRLVIGVLLLQDVLMIIIVVVLNRLEGGALAVAGGAGAVLLMFGLALVCQRKLMPSVVLGWNLDEETLLLGVLGVLFVFMGLAAAIGIPPMTGAFMAGFALSAFPVNGVVRGLILSLSDFFLAIFFVALGADLTIPSISYLINAAVLAAFVLFVTPPLVTAVAEWRGLTARAAIESGLLLAQTSEFSLVAVLTGVVLQHISGDVFSMLALVTVFTMTLTPFIATDATTRRLLRIHPLRRGGATNAKLQGHVLLLGFGSGGMWVIRPLMTQGHSILVVDDDPAVIEQLENQKVPSIRGDGSDEQTLERAGARSARLIIASMRRVEDSLGVISYAKPVPVVVRVFERADAEEVERRGGIPILNSVAAAETFIEWFATSGLVSRRDEEQPATV